MSVVADPPTSSRACHAGSSSPSFVPQSEYRRSRAANRAANPEGEHELDASGTLEVEQRRVADVAGVLLEVAQVNASRASIFWNGVPAGTAAASGSTRVTRSWLTDAIR